MGKWKDVGNDKGKWKEGYGEGVEVVNSSKLSVGNEGEKERSK